MIRFHLDEHSDHAIAAALRRRGIDVTTTTDAVLLAADDASHLSFALRDRRVIYTNDSDYLRMAAEGTPHAGIVYCRPASRSIGEIVAFLALLHDTMSESEMMGRVEYLPART